GGAERGGPVEGDQRTTTGAPASLFTVLVSGPGFALSAPLDGTCGGDCGPAGFSTATVSAPTNAVFNSAGQLIEFTWTNSAGDPVTNTLDIANGGTHATKPDGTPDFGTDGVLAWGRWVGQVVTTTTGSITNTFAA